MTIELYNEIDNASVQIGDLAYYSVVQTFGTSTDNPDTNVSVGGDANYIGVINNITGNTITIDNPISTDIPTDAFLLFSKSNQANSSRLKGYYASVTLINRDTNPIELFAISSEATGSSK